MKTPILEFIRKTWDRAGKAPAIYDIQVATGTNKIQVHDAIQGLREDGLIDYDMRPTTSNRSLLPILNEAFSLCQTQTQSTAYYSR